MARNVAEAGDRRDRRRGNQHGDKRRVDGVGAHSDRAGYRCAHADVAGHAPDPLRQTFAAPRFASIPDLKVLALRVEPASGRDDASAVQRPLMTCAFN